MKPPRKRTYALLTIVIASLTISACSSSNGSSKSPSTNGAGVGSSTVAPPTGTPIKIGFVTAASGNEISTNGAGAQVGPAWAKWVNDNGGINGHPVDVIVKDTRSEAATASAVLKDAVENDHVVALMIADNGTEASMLPYIQSSGLPVIGGTGYSPTTWTHVPNWFPMGISFPQSVTAQTQVAKDIGAKTYTAFVCAEVPQCAAAQDLTKPIEEKLGLTNISWPAVSASAPNYTAACLTIKKADFTNLILTPATGARVMQDCEQQGYTGTFGICCVSFSQAGAGQAPKGTKIAGVLDGFPWWADAAPVQQFRDVMARYSPKTDYRTTSATTIWQTLELFKATMSKTSGDITASSIIDAYGNIKDETLNGLLAMPLTFTKGQPAPSNSCYFGFTWTVGDKDPKTVIPAGKSANGATGDLSSTCLSVS